MDIATTRLLYHLFSRQLSLEGHSIKSITKSCTDLSLVEERACMACSTSAMFTCSQRWRVPSHTMKEAEFLIKINRKVIWFGLSCPFPYKIKNKQTPDNPINVTETVVYTDLDKTFRKHEHCKTKTSTTDGQTYVNTWVNQGHEALSKKRRD